MTAPASIPDPADWLVALVRGLHPARWLLCLAGLAVTAAISAVVQSWLDQQPPRWQEWFHRPGEQANALRAAVQARPPVGAAFLLSVPLAFCTAVWCLAGGWIARHELLCRRAARPDATDLGPAVGPTPLVLARGRALLLCCPIPILFTLLLLVPVTLAGRVNHWFGGPGAVLVALFLPVILLSGLILMANALGALRWPLMPVAIAAEGSDLFDALSRAYNYAFLRMVELAVLTSVTLGLGSLPLAAVRALADAVAAWPAEARLAVTWLAASLSASIFWSLQTLVYLHLRARIDEVDASEIAGDLSSPDKRVTPKEGEWSGMTAAVPNAARELTQMVLVLGLMVSAWCLTAWLFARCGGPQAGWLGWGLAGGFVPPARGLYKVASVIAGFWGVLWVGAPVVVSLRRLARGTLPSEPLDTPSGTSSSRSP